MRQERKQQKPRLTYKKSYERVLRIAEVFVNQNEGIKFVYYVCIGACIIKSSEIKCCHQYCFMTKTIICMQYSSNN